MTSPPPPLEDGAVAPASAGTALRNLMHELIDYAGLFPPAKLEMAPTVRNYAEYLGGDDSWMMNRLIAPVARLEEFEREADGLLPRGDEDDPWLISALTAPADEVVGLADDLDSIDAFNTRHRDADGGLALIDVIELKAASTTAIDDALDRIGEHLYPFFEFPSDDDPRGLIAALAGSDAGAKIRTGGVTVEAIPSPDEVARFIAACARASVPFKATAGLHHPLRHFNETIKTTMHGFLNVFIAGCLAWHHELNEDTVQAILEEESIKAFSISTTGIAWGELAMAADEVEDARLGLAVSFGSCSFDEPREDLRALRLL